MEYYLLGISALFSLALSELSSDQSMSVTATRTSPLPAMAVCPSDKFYWSTFEIFAEDPAPTAYTIFY